MALDGLFINKLVLELQEIIKMRINKVYQLGNDEFLFNMKHKDNKKLLISTNAANYRIHLTQKNYATPKEPSSFVMFLRKHLEGGIIREISQISLDRIVKISIIKQNELKDLEEKFIFIELVGKASNLIVTDENLTIIDSLKHVLNIENDKIVMPKAKYKINIDKGNVFEEEITELSKSELQKKYYGVSPLLYEAYSNNPINFFNKLKSINVVPQTFSHNDKEQFYFTNLFNNENKTYNTLSELLDYFYFDKASLSVIKQKMNNIDTTVRRLIERTRKKISNQELEIDNAKNNESFKIYGELITANLYQLPQSAKTIEVFNYYTNENITINLEPLLSVKQNAAKYFTKYQKMKKSIIHLERQIMLSKAELDYLNIILMQISHANLNDIQEIKNELIANKYLIEKKVNKKKEKINLLTYITDEGSEITVGKNNTQNEYLTHKVAKYNELWFHVKDGPGSHVVLRKSDNFTETDIRTSALLAAYYSNYKQSSSVEVCYTLVKYIKKIPGMKNCFVTFTNEKTIFIDPDIKIIDKLAIK